MPSLRIPKLFAPSWNGLLVEEPRRVSEVAEGNGFYKLGVVEESREALAATGVLPGKGAPYVERDVDGELRALLRKGSEPGGPALVVVSGPPLVGKSRTLAQALSAELPDAWLLAPRDAGALISLGRQGGARSPFQTWVIWLDDLERFVAGGEDGLNAGSLGLFGAWRKPPLIVATAGGKGLRLAQHAAFHSELQAQLLNLEEVASVNLGDSLSEAELTRLRSLPDLAPDIAERVVGAGIGAYMLGRGVARLLLDVPSERPVLGFEQISRALAETIMQSDPRFAIGVFGGWGSGKTTLMQAIERKLDHREVVSVRFVAWRYEKEEHLIVPLLDVIREGLLRWAEEHGQDGSARETAATIGRVLRSLVAGLTLKVGLPGAVEASFEANSALQEHSKLSEEDKQTRTPRSFYHASFRALEEAFKKFAGAGTDRRIVVFVDDLDRCLPENALQVLESMKLFFDLDGFVFVVGLDEDIIEYAVEKKYADRARPPADTTPHRADGEVWRISGREYIKKVFQLPFRLKPVSVQDLGRFIQAASHEAGLFPEQRQDLRSTVEGHLAYMVGDGTVNPREVKRYINLYTLQLLVNPELDRNALLALQTISFRRDWEEAIWSRLVESREQYLDAVRQRLAAGASDGDAAEAYRDFGPFPEDFLEYVAERAPGRELLLVENLEAYLSLGEAVRSASDPALREAINELGQARSLLRTVSGLTPDSTDLSLTTTELIFKLSSVQGRVTAAASGSAPGRSAIESVRLLREKAEQALDGAHERSPSDYDEAILELRREASVVAKRLWRLYRLGDVAGAPVGTVTTEPPLAGALAEPPPVSALAEPPVASVITTEPPATGAMAEAPTPSTVAAPAAPSRDGSDGASGRLQAEDGPPPRRESARPPRVQLRLMREVGPRELGVRDSFVDSSTYVTRDVDGTLREMLAKAVSGDGPSVILLAGPSLAGKTRTAYEALVAEADLSESAVFAPRSLAELAQLSDPRVVLVAPPGPLFMWMDDLDRLREVDGRGLRLSALVQGLLGRPVVVLGTLTERSDDPRPGSSDSGLERGEILGELISRGLVGVIRLERMLSAGELERLRAAYPSLNAAKAAEGGIGALLMGRDGLVAKLEAGWREQPEGAAVVCAAVDWMRAGIPMPIGEQVLRSLWSKYLEAEGREPSDSSFTRGLGWALAPGPESAAPLLEVEDPGGQGGSDSEPAYEAHPLAVDFEDRKLAREIDPDAWEEILAHADPQAALSLGVAAVRRGNTGQAAKAFIRAERSQQAELAGAAGAGIGKLLLDAGDRAGAEAAFARADALGNVEGATGLAQLLEDRGELIAAEAALRHADERGDPDAALRLGRLRERREDLDGAIAAYRRADERSEVDGTIALARLLNQTGDTRGAEQALRRAAQTGNTTANFNLGLLLQQRGDFTGAQAVLQTAAEGGDARGALTLGLLLERQGERAQALQWQRFAAEKGDQMAAYNLGRLLYEEGQRKEAEEWLRASTDPLAAELLRAIAHEES
jgi:tetratricopeptide (TPR) repeat protein